MSGSGSSIFGVFNDKNSLKDLKKTLEKQGDRVYFTKFHHNIK
jgi:4-diphosphocytidyl-2C-methyl-D-erythritol kinase